MFSFSGCFAEKASTNYSGGKGSTALTFDSFDGGGPEYSVKLEDESVVSCKQTRHYNSPKHEQMTGSGYTVKIEFFGLKPGKTTATVECRSPIADNFDAIYDIEVNEDLGVTVTERERTDILP